VVQGKVLDATSAAVSFIVPAVCFAVVTMYAVYDLRAKPAEPSRSAADEVAS
jgi:FHS family L-fucose permease-like MFS transporter